MGLARIRARSLAGIGFTMALFTAGLAFEADHLLPAKSGVLVGSLASAILGVLILKLATTHAMAACDSSQRWPRSPIRRRASTDVATTAASAAQPSKAGCPRPRLSRSPDTDDNLANGYEVDKYFYRLGGDTNGDRRVDSLDLLAVNALLAGGGYDADVNGDGAVNAQDRLLVMRGRNKALAPQLRLDN